MALYSELGVVEAELPIVLNRTVTNYGAGGGSEPSGTTYNSSASDSIEFYDTVGGVIFNRVLTDTIEFSDTVISSLQTPFATDEFELSDETRRDEKFNELITETIQFTDLTISSLQTPFATDTIHFLDFASNGLDVAGAKTASASDDIELSDVADKTKILIGAIACDASDTIVLTTILTIPIEVSASDTIEFTTVAASELTKFVEDTIVFTDLAAYQTVRELTITETIRFVDFVVWETDEPDLCGYSPSVGSGGGDAPDPPSGTAPTLIQTSSVTLYYPTVSPSSSVTIRSPEFGNRDRLLFERINRESRGGTLLIYADPIWAKIQRIVVTFTGLKESEGQAVLDFFQETLGREIGFKDWEGRTWHGVILTPDEPLIRNHRTYVDISFEFEGEEQ